MAIPSVIQGLIEAEDGKVFELESSRGSAWLESIGSFRFEPSGDSKPCTIRKESGYWYGCRKIAGKVRKKYIGKSSEVSVAKLEEIAEALDIPPVPQADKVAQQVAEVTEKVTEKVAEAEAEVTEVAQDKLTALEIQVANLQKAVEALQELLPGKLDAGNSLELPKVDNEVVEGLHNELGNLKTENELLRQELENTKLQLENRPPTSGHLYQEIEQLKDRNRLLHIKSREERQKLQEELAALKYRDESQSRRLQAKQARLDELEVQIEEVTGSELHTELNNLKAENEKLRADYVALLESSTAVTNKLREEVQELRSQLEEERAYKKDVEDECWDKEESLNQTRAELVDREKDLAVALAEVLDLKQKSAAAGKDLPEAADLLNQLKKAKGKKFTASLTDVEAILKMLEDS